MGIICLQPVDKASSTQLKSCRRFLEIKERFLGSMFGALQMATAALQQSSRATYLIDRLRLFGDGLQMAKYGASTAPYNEKREIGHRAGGRGPSRVAGGGVND